MIDWQLANQEDDYMQANRRLEGKVEKLENKIKDLKSLIETMNDELFYANHILGNSGDERPEAIDVINKVMERFAEAIK
jgi:archaellum component FlaC